MSALPARLNSILPKSELLVLGPQDVAALRRGLETSRALYSRPGVTRFQRDGRTSEAINSAAGDSGQTGSGRAV